MLITLVCFAELLTDFSYMNFTVSYTDALDRLCVHLNIILLIYYLYDAIRYDTIYYLHGKTDRQAASLI